MSKLPVEVTQALDAWSQETMATSRWTAVPVLKTGRSIACVWKLHLDSPIQSMAFALRSWGWSNDQKTRLEAILDFQAKLGDGYQLSVAETPFKFASSDSRIISSQERIIPEIVAWHPGLTILEANKTLWTLSTWCAGEPLDFGLPVTDNLLHQAVSCLAKFHAIGRSSGLIREIPVGLHKRCECVQRWLKDESRLVFDTWLLRNKKIASARVLELVWQPLSSIARRGLLCFEPTCRQISSPMNHWFRTPRYCHWIVGDLWRENVLVENDRIRGIVDFGASRVDWPAMEIVRWLSSWLAPDDDRLGNLLSRYALEFVQAVGRHAPNRSIAVEPPLELVEFQALDRLSTLTAFFQWLDWLSENRFDHEQIRIQIIPRLLELVTRLECSHC